MAADWIPCEIGLFKKAEVLAIASKTKRSRHDVGGLLLEFWGWCSNESTDGHMPNVGINMLPDIIGGDRRFWDAVVAAGWLIVDGDGFVVPNAERWISRGAKARLGAARRKQKQRDGTGRMSRSERDTGHSGGVTNSVTTGQNRRDTRDDRTQKPAAVGLPPVPIGSTEGIDEDPDPDGSRTLAAEQREQIDELRALTGETGNDGLYATIVRKLGKRVPILASRLRDRLSDTHSPVQNAGATMVDLAREIATDAGIQLFRKRAAA